MWLIKKIAKTKPRKKQPRKKKGIQQQEDKNLKRIAQFISEPGNAAFGSTEYWVFRARKEVADPGYIYYLARSDIIRQPAEKSMVGASGRQRAAVAAIENPDLRKHYEVRVPGKIDWDNARDRYRRTSRTLREVFAKLKLEGASGRE